MASARQYERYPEILSRIDRVRHKRKSTLVAQWILTYIGLMLTLLLAFCLGESLVHFSAGTRRIMAGVLLLALLGGGYLFVLKPIFADWSFEQIALFIEGVYPEMRNGLINAIRLSKAKVVVSPPMVNEAIREIADETSHYDFNDAVNRKPLSRAATFAGVATALTMGVFIFAPDRFGNSFKRICEPLSDVPALGDIKIDKVEPGDATVISGDDVVVTATIINPTGRSADGVLHYRPEEGDERVQVMTPRSEIMFGAEIPGVKIPFKYRVNVGGTESRWFRVRVVDEPQVIGITLEYTFPAYAGKPPETVKNSDGNIKALIGTVVDMTILSNKKLERARLRLNDEQDMPLKVQPDGLTLTMAKRMAVTKDGSYTIHIEDTENYTNRNPITYYIRAVPDEKPVVKIGLPGKDTSVALGSKLAVGIKATDDYGLSKIELLCQKTGADAAQSGPEQVVHTWTEFPDGKNASLAFDWTFPKDRYKIGDVITYYARATDNKPGDDAGVNNSSKFKVEIKDIKAERAAKQKAYFEWRNHVEKALGLQMDARKRSDALLRALGVNPDELKPKKKRKKK